VEYVPVVTTQGSAAMLPMSCITLLLAYLLAAIMVLITTN